MGAGGGLACARAAGIDASARVTAIIHTMGRQMWAFACVSHVVSVAREALARMECNTEYDTVVISEQSKVTLPVPCPNSSMPPLSLFAGTDHAGPFVGKVASSSTHRAIRPFSRRCFLENTLLQRSLICQTPLIHGRDAVGNTY